MTERMTSEMLMAFVDGELDAATARDVERVLRDDEQAAAEAEEFRRSRELARQAFSFPRHEPVPDRLVAAIRDGAAEARRQASPQKDQVLAFPRRFSGAARSQLAWAAALVLCLGMGFVAGRAQGPTQMPGDEGLVGPGPVATALGETGGGETREVALAGGSGQLTTRASYPVVNGLCRSFELDSPDSAVVGVGCRLDEGAWRIELALSNAVAPSGDFGGYAPAGGAGLAAIDAYLDSLEAGPSLPAGQ